MLDHLSHPDNDGNVVLVIIVNAATMKVENVCGNVSSKERIVLVAHVGIVPKLKGKVNGVWGISPQTPQKGRSQRPKKED